MLTTKMNKNRFMNTNWNILIRLMCWHVWVWNNIKLITIKIKVLTRIWLVWAVQRLALNWIWSNYDCIVKNVWPKIYLTSRIECLFMRAFSSFALVSAYFDATLAFLSNLLVTTYTLWYNSFLLPVITFYALFWKC